MPTPSLLHVGFGLLVLYRYWECFLKCCVFICVASLLYLKEISLSGHMAFSSLSGHCSTIIPEHWEEGSILD